MNYNAIHFGIQISNLLTFGLIKYQNFRRINWYIKYPRKEMRSDYYLQPFDTHIWFVLLSVTIFGTILIILVQSFIQSNKRFLIDDLFLGLESFCNQCGNDFIENFSLRLICIALRLISLASIAFYGAIITSFFAVEVVEPPFTNLEEFVANGEYRLILEKDGTIVPFLEVRSRRRHFFIFFSAKIRF